VEVEARRCIREAKLGAEQLHTVTKLMEDAALTIRDKAYQQMAASFRASVAPGTQMQMDQLNLNQQQALMEAIRKASTEASKMLFRRTLQAVPSKLSAERFKH
jgi:hypothetical protein